MNALINKVGTRTPRTPLWWALPDCITVKDRTRTPLCAGRELNTGLASISVEFNGDKPVKHRSYKLGPRFVYKVFPL